MWGALKQVSPMPFPGAMIHLDLVNQVDEDREAVITIDDQELSLRQFGRLLTTYSGWGMRIVFVPDHELADSPRIEVREPSQPKTPQYVLCGPSGWF